MWIKINADAGNMYIQDNTDYSGTYFGNDQWETILFKLAGKLVEVDTEELFKHEFNTKPVVGVTREGIRIPEEYVIEVIDDERKGKARCDLCNRTSNSDEVCSHCGRSDYLEPFFEEEW
ncbi:hypothetical protein [Priestia megaterium]|uniref:hypothetical protein n=1 Tax=Priestia megaterium TaxID=1404 RepID=UPI000BEB7FF6|nr:hypothetical protein [Priestia megaterium]PED64044.1 hypothetical protein CON20_24075 [Priestia megaterium]